MSNAFGVMSQEVKRILEIAGAEDGSDAGKDGHLTVNGRLAEVLIQTLDLSDRLMAGVKGYPVRISRCGHLELWCNGFYVEGSGVRRIVHEAARRLAT